MASPKHPPGPPMTLGNMRRQGVRSLIAYCLNDACRHQAIIDVSSYPGDTLVSWFRSKVKCAKCAKRHSRTGSPMDLGTVRELRVLRWRRHGEDI
jgi:transposase